MSPVRVGTAWIPGSVLHSLPYPAASDGKPVAISAKGIRFTLEDGSEVVDGTSCGAAVSCIGMGIPEVVDAMQRQMSTMAFSYHAVFENRPTQELTDFILDRSDGAFERAVYYSSGSEAIEASLKMIRQYWLEQGEPDRQLVIGRRLTYHGNTFGAMNIGHNLRSKMYRPLFAGTSTFHHVSPANYRRGARAGESEVEYSERLAQELDDKIVELGAGRVMAFYAETVVGSSQGVMPPPKGYFPAIRRVLDKHNVLLVLDEVMSGMDRIGSFHAWQTVGEGVRPDLQTIAKGLGGGYMPISGVLLSGRLSLGLQKGVMHSQTYQTHPLASAAALAVQRYIETHDMLANCRDRGAQLLLALKQGLEGLHFVWDVRGVGLFLAIEFDHSLFDETASPRFAAQVQAAARAHGFLMTGSSGIVDGSKGECVYLAPAYTITSEEATLIADLAIRSIKAAWGCYAQRQ